MKFAYIANARIPTEKAHGLQIMRMLEAFSKSGYPVCHSKIGGVRAAKKTFEENILKNKIKAELIIPKRLNKIKTEINEYYGVKPIFKIKRLPCLDLSGLGLDGVKIGFFIQSFTFAASAAVYIFFKKFDIVYSRGRFSLLPFIFSRKKLFFEAHNIPSIFFIYKILFKRMDGIIAITENIKNTLSRKGISVFKIIVAPDGVDFKKFDISISKNEARKKINLPVDKKIILYSGHLYPWKGAAVLLSSARNFLDEFLFVFVGGTDKDIKDFKEKAEKDKLRNVFFAGHKPHNEIPLWLKAADVLVLPNSAKEKISAFYTSPLKMFEYMAAKRPIITSNLPSIREVLDNSNSVLAEADDPDSFSDAIKKVLQDEELSVKISDNAYHAAKNYTWEIRARRIINFVMRDRA